MYIRTLIILIVLAFHFKVWRIVSLNRRVKAVLAERKSIGMFPQEYKFTLKDALTYGHWITGMKFSDWWWKNWT